MVKRKGSFFAHFTKRINPSSVNYATVPRNNEFITPISKRSGKVNITIHKNDKEMLHHYTGKQQENVNVRKQP